MIDAVLLIAFGGPERPEDVRPFLQLVTAGRRIPPERLEEVAHHYDLMGGRCRCGSACATGIRSCTRPWPR